MPTPKLYLLRYFLQQAGNVRLFANLHALQNAFLRQRNTQYKKQYNNLVNEIRLFENNKDNLKYNILGTSLVYFNIPRKRENYYFCSEFVSEVLINSGIFNTDKKPEEILPLDLLAVENKTLIYEGYINKLNFAIETLSTVI